MNDVDTGNLLERIRQIINSYGLSNSQFCEKIGVQRSLLSHVLSKRNRPSLDFLLKIYHGFDFVTLDWLLLGKGDVHLPQNLFRKESQVSETHFLDMNKKQAKENQDNNQIQENPSPTQQENPVPESLDSKESQVVDAVDEIIFFYPDKTFKRFQKRIN